MATKEETAAKVEEKVAKAVAKAVKAERSRIAKALAAVSLPEGVTVRQGYDIRRALKTSIADAQG